MHMNEYYGCKIGGIVMAGSRQDGWSQDEDLYLAEVVLRHIREGGTQLKAFEEVGKGLSRTSAACGFRWNSFVRKQYKDGIEVAKKVRKELKKAKIFADEEIPQITQAELANDQSEMANPKLTLDTIIHYLTELKDSLAQHSFSSQQELIHEHNQLKKHADDLTEQRDILEKKYKQMSDDYHALVGVLEKARQLAEGKK